MTTRIRPPHRSTLRWPATRNRAAPVYRAVRRPRHAQANGTRREELQGFVDSDGSRNMKPALDQYSLPYIHGSGTFEEAARKLVDGP